jgi:transcriptional regulator with XRE-family HTH domain
MGQDIPPAPPEAEVIRLARKAAGMTAEAAAAASKAHDPAGKGVSVTYWRDVERGQGGRRGLRVATRASDRILAAMARVVGVTPPELTSAGREDAARVLDEMLRREERPAVPAPPPSDPGSLSFPVDRDMAARSAPHIAEINGRLAVWTRSEWQHRGEAAIGAIPDGETLFPDRPQDARTWDAMIEQGFLGEKYTLLQLVQGVAIKRVQAEERRQDRQGSGGVAAGLMRRLTRTAHTGRNPPDVTIRSHSAAF